MKEKMEKPAQEPNNTEPEAGCVLPEEVLSDASGGGALSRGIQPIDQPIELL